MFLGVGPEGMDPEKYSVFRQLGARMTRMTVFHIPTLHIVIYVKIKPSLITEMQEHLAHLLSIFGFILMIALCFLLLN